MGKRDNRRPLTEVQKKLASDNVGLVFYALRTLKNTGLGPDERLSACGIALVHAARTFDPKKGGFSPHYFRWARSICDVDACKGMIAVPRRFRKTIEFTRVGSERVIATTVAYPAGHEVNDIPFSVLTKRQREIVTAISIYGKTKAETAAELGVTKNNVNTTYAKAVQKLKTEVKKRRDKQ